MADISDKAGIARTSLTRRSVLAGAAAGAAATAAATMIPGTAHAAEPAAATAATTYTAQQQAAQANIKHIVFLMMENRSFDHLFGTLSGVRGFDDRTVARPDGGNIFAQYDATAKAYELPYRLDQASGSAGDADLSHNWGPQHMSLNAVTNPDGTVVGRNDMWINAHRLSDGTDGVYTMGYLTRADVPYHYAMADAFTICDNYFCSVLGPTYPNRLMWEMGSIDALAQGGGPLLTTDESVFTNNDGMGVFSYKTYPEKLTAAGITWQAYTDEASNHLLNMFPSFTQYNVQTPSATSTPTSIANNATNVSSGTLGSSQPGFLADLQAGNLPQVSWIFPTAQATEHPGDGPINAGPGYYEPIITALMASESWANTVLFITYDENDGYFDHVPPPQAPVGTVGEYLKGIAFGASGASTDPTTGKTTYSNDPSDTIQGPVGLGFRVPNIAISPWSTGGRVNSELFDHTSCLKLVETVFAHTVPTMDISPRGIVSDWRYNLVGDLTSVFDFSTATPAGTPPAALQTAFAASQALLTGNPTDDETPPADQSMPTQEQTPVRTRVGPTPDFGTAAAPVAALPEAATPVLLLGAGIAAASGVVAARRIRSGGKSDATHAGGHLRAPVPAPSAEPTDGDDLTV